MTDTFRVKVRVKAYKKSITELDYLYRKAVDQLRGNHPPTAAVARCPRCGIDPNGCRPNPCMHGSECGNPLIQQPRPVFIPSVWVSPQPTTAVPPELCRSISSARNEQIWN